jgi:hypothetical protein
MNKIFKYLSLNNNYSLIGSNSDLQLKYNTDYDLQEIINDFDPEIILNKFQDKFKFAKNNKSYYIIDFKSGIRNTIPIRWNYTDLMNGYQSFDGDIVYFKNTLNNNLGNIVKLDLIVFIKNTFVEFSCNYYFSETTTETYQIYNSLLIDIKLYYHEQKYYKLLKRLFSYLRIKNNKHKQNILIKFFNSHIGYLNQLEHKINVLIDVMQNKFKPINNKHLNIALNNLKNMIPDKYIKYFNNLNLLKNNIHNDINLQVVNFVYNL